MHCGELHREREREREREKESVRAIRDEAFKKSSGPGATKAVHKK